MNDLSDLSSVISKLSELQKEVHAISDNINEMSYERKKTLDELSTSVDASNIWNIRYKDLNAIPGARTPKWYTVDIDYISQETQSKSRALEISPDGVFVCQQIQAYYLVLDSDKTHYPVFAPSLVPSGLPYLGAYGRYLPCTAAMPLMKGQFRNFVASAPTTPLAPDSLLNYMYEIPEFSFQFESSSSGKSWCNKPIPAAFLYGLYSPLQANGFLYLQRNDRLIVTSKPETRVPLTGRVRVVLHGYQILGNIDVDKYLGV
jgi:hypothetical protein